MGFLPALALNLIVLKMFGLIGISWFWAFSPIIFEIGIVISLTLIGISLENSIKKKY